MKKQCYFCSQDATSVEHAPAKSFFPKNLRTNLITVDSCPTHNELTSLDDEYVRNIIAMSIGNNKVAYDHFLDKCVRSFQHSPKLLNAITSVWKRIWIKPGNVIIPTLAFQIDRVRFDRVMMKIAYAIFFHTFRIPWNRELIVMTEYLRNPDMTPDEYGTLIQSFKPLIGLHTYNGTNPQVFQFKFMQT